MKTITLYIERKIASGSDARARVFDLDLSSTEPIFDFPLWQDVDGQRYYAPEDIADAKGLPTFGAGFFGDFYFGLAADRITARYGRYFDGDTARIRVEFVDRLLQAAGTPETYTLAIEDTPRTPAAFTFSTIAAGCPVFALEASADASLPTYRLYRASAPAGTYTLVGTAANNALTITDATYPGGLVEYRATHVNSRGEESEPTAIVPVELVDGMNVALYPNVPYFTAKDIGAGIIRWNLTYLADDELAGCNKIEIRYTTNGSTPTPSSTLGATVTTAPGHPSFLQGDLTGFADGQTVKLAAFAVTTGAGYSISTVAAIVVDSQGAEQGEALIIQTD